PGLPTPPPPLIDSARIEFPDPDHPQLVIEGSNFGPAAEMSAKVVFAEPSRNYGLSDFAQSSGTELRLRIPPGLPLASSSIFVTRRPAGAPNTRLSSNAVVLTQQKVYAFVAESFNQKVAVFDTGTPGQTRTPTLVKEISLSGDNAPLYIAT